MSTEYFLIPQNKNFNQNDVFESTIRMICMFGNFSFEKVAEYAYTIGSKEDQNIGFDIDWIESTAYDWEDTFDLETEGPSGPLYTVRTHGISVPFTLNFLTQLNYELEKKELNFNICDPQENHFIIK